MRFLFVTLLFLISLPGFSQIPVWQGFELNWTYNHRLNRMGSYIYSDSVYNTAATGLGKDSAAINTHYLLLDGKDKKFTEFRIYKRIEARENEMIQFQIDTMIPISFHHSVFFINGFDIIANNDADKLQLMDFGVKMVKGNEDTTYLRINISLIFNCQSLECDWVNNDVDYDLNLFLGCVTFTGEEYISYVKGEMYNAKDQWTRKVNLPSVKIPGAPNTPQFITNFKISLNKAHWYSGVSMFIASDNSTTMKFEQYKPKMKKHAYYKPHANFSKKTKGSALYSMEGIAITKPANFKSVHYEFKSGLIWKGNNKTAFSKDAVRSLSVK